MNYSNACKTEGSMHLFYWINIFNLDINDNKRLINSTLKWITRESLEAKNAPQMAVVLISIHLVQVFKDMARISNHYNNNG